MYLIELLLPLYDNEGQAFDARAFTAVRRELLEKFGGVTGHLQSPAQGLWQDDDGQVRRDDVIVFEVMAESLDREWWTAWRRDLERRFRQDEVIVRATRVERL